MKPHELITIRWIQPENARKLKWGHERHFMPKCDQCFMQPPEKLDFWVIGDFRACRDCLKKYLSEADEERKNLEDESDEKSK